MLQAMQFQVAPPKTKDDSWGKRRGLPHKRGRPTPKHDTLPQTLLRGCIDVGQDAERKDAPGGYRADRTTVFSMEIEAKEI